MRTILANIVLLLAFTNAAAAEPSKVRASSFVVLAEPRLPASTDFRTAVEARLKGRLKIDNVETDDKKVILLRIRGGTVMVGLIEARLPAGTIDDLCKGAWYWRAACESTSGHKAHVYVSTLDTDLDQLDAALLQTDVVASLMDENALASYWGASLQSKDAFLKQSARASRDNPPVWLWVNFRLSNDIEKGWSLSTQGLDSFSLNEIEAKDAKRDGREVFTLLMSTARYLVQKGPVIKDGETIGDSPSQNIRVRKAPSYWREGLTVYRVTFP
jgi:hypothetical protein